MSVNLIESNNDGFSIKLSFKYSKSMFQGEKDILSVINEAGAMATGKLLEQFDTDGSPIKKGNQTFTSKGMFNKNYQTPYGVTSVERYVYQSHSGGKTYCPLEEDARIVITSTPKFAQMISSKYSQLAVRPVIKDLESNHDRKVQKKLVQDVSEAVGSVILAKESSWKYDIPEFDEAVQGITIGLDGTCMLMKDDGWREAMTGTITLFNKFGEKMHTRYVAAPPEYGKETFIEKFERDIKGIESKFPNVFKLGLADGARDNWPFLEKHTDHQLLDFYHASEYIGRVGKVIFSDSQEREDWIEDRCHKLKHNMGAASRLITEFKELKSTLKKKADKEIISAATTYMINNNQKDRMQYYKFEDSVLPLGSGATEAACKVIVKQRMCKSGMRWRNEGAQIVLATRCLHETDGNWEQFWDKVDCYGFNIAA